MEEVKWDILFCIYCNGFDFRLLYFSFNEKCQLGKPSLFKKKKDFLCVENFSTEILFMGKISTNSVKNTEVQIARGDLGKTILTLQLKQARIFAVKGYFKPVHT